MYTGSTPSLKRHDSRMHDGVFHVCYAAGSFGLGPGVDPRPVAAASSAGGLLQGRIIPPPDAALPESPAGAGP